MKNLFCIECGSELDTSLDAIYPPQYTDINGKGPYCISCLMGASEQEKEANSQFGVGA